MWNNKKTDLRPALDSIRLKLVLYFVLFLILPMSVFTVVEYRHEKELIREGVTSQLSEMADSRKAVVESWLGARIADVRVLAGNVLLREHFTALSKNRPQDVDALRRDEKFAELDDYVKRIASSYGYLEADICDNDGYILVSSNPDMLGGSLKDTVPFERALAMPAGEVHIEDIAYSEKYATPVMSFSVPVEAYGRDGPLNPGVAGVAVIVFDIRSSLYPILTWTGVGRSGETLLVRRQQDSIVILNPLRSSPNAPPMQRISVKPGLNIPVYLAASGKSGMIETRDYRGVAVLAAYRYLPLTGWGLITKMDASEAFSPVSELWKGSVLTLALSAIFVVMLIVVITGKIVNPITALAESTRKLARGDFSVSLPEPGNDEIGELTRSFNAMTQELKRSHGELGLKSTELEAANRELLSLAESLEEKVAERTSELEQLNRNQSVLFKDLDERSAALEKSRNDLKMFAKELEDSKNRVKENLEIVERANVELRRMDKMKDHFLGMISHELRTPLSLIMGYSSNMLSDPSLKLVPQVEEELEGIYKGADRLRSIITEMLDVSRIDSRGLMLNLRPVNAGKLVEEVVAELNLFIKERGQRVEVGDFSAIPPLMLDRGKMYQVLVNVMGNAIKFTPDGGDISVMPVVQPVSPRFIEENMLDYTEQLDIVVKDGGIGLDKGELSRIFEKFYEVGDIEKHTTSKFQFLGRGVGLGLPIARGIVEAHGGMLWAESDGYDPVNCPGSSFHMLIPVRASGPLPFKDAPAAEDVAAMPSGTHDIPAGLPVGTDIADAGRHATDRAKVLVIEDDPDVLNLTIYVLKKKYDVYKALDGQEGLRLARMIKPDLVLLDVYMEGMNGYEVCEKLKKDSDTADITVAMFTAGVQKWEVDKGFESGADDYITKPFKPDDLLDKVGRLISGKLEDVAHK